MEGTRSALIKLVLKAAACLVATLVFVASASAQQGQQGEEQETKVVPALRFSIGEQFSDAQACLDEEDVECAVEILADIAKIRDLKTYERGQL